MSSTRPRGFSLLELMVAMVILVIVIGVVVAGVADMTKSNAAEDIKVDMTQEARQFIDQVVQDLHHSGFPSSRLFASSASAVSVTFNCEAITGTIDGRTSVAVGLIDLTSSCIHFEGDVDGSGNVSEVYVQASAGPCPCTISRGTVYKTSYLAGGTPTYYIQVSNVNTRTPFQAYDNDGNLMTLPCNIATGCSDSSHTSISNIKAIRIKLPMQASIPNSVNNSYTTISMTAAAKINN
jgi:prepilin-type N-terminal cleavage/methylation domain-containing protein